MVKTKTFKSDILAAIHETASDLHEADVMEKQTLREFDELCLTEVKLLSSDEIRKIRIRERMSQAVFARYLNVTTGLVSQWERGQKNPSGAALKLLTLVKEKGVHAIT